METDDATRKRPGRPQKFADNKLVNFMLEKESRKILAAIDPNGNRTEGLRRALAFYRQHHPEISDRFRDDV